MGIEISISKLRILAITAIILLGTFGIYWQSIHAKTQNHSVASTNAIVLGMGCFWGAEKRMAALPGVVDAVSGYAGGSYTDPTYEKVLQTERKPGVRNYAEVVKVTFDPGKTSVEQVLIGFWENHDPTQGDRQGNDIGTNYRSAIYYNSETQKKIAEMSRDAYQIALDKAGKGRITTEIAALDTFYPAEEYHQDYLIKNPNGYCGLGGTGIKFPSGMQVESAAQLKSLDPTKLTKDLQLIVFETEHCPFCELFRKQVLNNWRALTPIATSLSPQPPKGWVLEKPLWATPTIVLFKDGKESARYTGYSGEDERFWKWLGFSTLSE